MKLEITAEDRKNSSSYTNSKHCIGATAFNRVYPGYDFVSFGSRTVTARKDDVYEHYELSHNLMNLYGIRGWFLRWKPYVVELTRVNE